MKNASKKRDTVTKRHGGCRANHWAPGGAALGIPPLQELKKKTGQCVKLRSPYRTSRRPANSVCSILYVRGGAGAELRPTTRRKNYAEHTRYAEHTLAKFCGPRTAGKRRWKDDCTDVTACLRLTTDWLKDLTEESAQLSGKVARLKRADSRSKIASASASKSASESASENLDSAAAGAAADAAADAIQSAGTTLNRACLRACFVRACVRVRARARARTRALAG